MSPEVSKLDTLLCDCALIPSMSATNKTEAPVEFNPHQERDGLHADDVGQMVLTGSRPPPTELLQETWLRLLQIHKTHLG